MKDGRGPLLPMHSDACAVSEGEPNQGKGKVSKHRHNVWLGSGNKYWKRRQSSRTLPPYYGYCDNAEVMLAISGLEGPTCKVCGLPSTYSGDSLCLQCLWTIFVANGPSPSSSGSTAELCIFSGVAARSLQSLWTICLSVWLAGYPIVSCLCSKLWLYFLVSAMSLNNLSGNLVTSETCSACCWYSSLWAIKCYRYVSLFLRSHTDLICLLYYYYLNKLNCFIIYYLRERGGH